MLEQVERRSLAEGVFRQLCDRILDGRLQAGARLPGERELCTQLAVNRNAVREALKRLEQLRLVAIHPGGTTRVLDYRANAGLDVLVFLLFGEGSTLKLEAARSLVELRSALGPDIAARAAARGGPARAAELSAIVDKMHNVVDRDPVVLDGLSLELWRVLVDASQNLAYRLAFNTMERAWVGIKPLIAPALANEVRDTPGYRTLVRAVGSGDVERARRAAGRLVSKGEEGLQSLLGVKKGKTR